MNRIIISGATGVIGNALVELANSLKMEIILILRPGSKKNILMKQTDRISIIESDINTYCDIKSEKRDFDIFFHLAWAFTDKEGRNSFEKQALNVRYVEDAVRLAERFKCSIFVGSGSQAEYGRFNESISEEFEAKPETEYGKAKLEACIKSRKLCRKLGIKHIWPRIFSVYGPHDAESTLILYLIRTLLKGEKPELSACTQNWDYLYSADCARALFLLAEKGSNGEVYNIGGGECRKLIEYVKILRDVINPKAQLGLGEVKTPPEGLMNLCADISKLKRDTGFMPQLNFEDGIKETIKWVKGV